MCRVTTDPNLRARIDVPAAGTSGSAGVLVLTLARPEKKNALTPSMLAALASAVSGASAQGVACVLIEGEGAALCAGFDLSLCRTDDAALGALLNGLSAVIAELRACPLPVVIAAHGSAIAGGCALLAGADIVITHTDCKLGYPVVKLGISPAVSAPTLRQSIGDGSARERLLGGDLFSGWDALRLGLAHECLPDAGKVRDRALAVARTLALKPVSGMRATKALLNQIDSPALDAGLNASLAIVNSPEQRARLAELWTR